MTNRVTITTHRWIQIHARSEDPKLKQQKKHDVTKTRLQYCCVSFCSVCTSIINNHQGTACVHLHTSKAWFVSGSAGYYCCFPCLQVRYIHTQARTKVEHRAHGAPVHFMQEETAVERLTEQGISHPRSTSRFNLCETKSKITPP